MREITDNHFQLRRSKMVPPPLPSRAASTRLSGTTPTSPGPCPITLLPPHPESEAGSSHTLREIRCFYLHGCPVVSDCPSPGLTDMSLITNLALEQPVYQSKYRATMSFLSSERKRSLLSEAGFPDTTNTTSGQGKAKFKAYL